MHRFIVSSFLVLITVIGFAQTPSPAKARPKAKRLANPAFAPIQDEAGLPRVLLIGDSISIGYTIAVRELLKGKANVHRIPTNGGPTTNGMKSIKAWMGTSKWDVIHFNWGLHDLKYIMDDPSKRADPKTPGAHHQVSLLEYEKNLTALVIKLKSTGAQLIWCNTTPVPEGSEGRIVGEEQAFNEAAARVMKAAGIPTNDLHSHAKAKLNEVQLPANVHFSPEGSKYLATQVASSIEGFLRKK
jgi:acyl-CoA thioesterase-1